MAKVSTPQTRALARIQRINVPKPIVIKVPTVPRAMTKHKSSGKKHHVGGNGGSVEELATIAAGGYLASSIEASPSFAMLPDLPIVGKLGSAALLAWYFGKSNKTVGRIAKGMLAVAAYKASQASSTTQGVSGYGPGVAAVM